MNRVSMSRSNFAANLLHPMDWKTLTPLQDWENAFEAAHSAPIVVFKHSTRCSVSRMALKFTERQWDLPANVDAYFLDLLANRKVSDAIAEQMNVTHQSPQLLCIREAKCTYNASHEHIDPLKVKPYL